MKKIKYLLILIILLISTGCSGNYDLKINADLSIDEKLNVSFKNEEGLYKKTLKIFQDNGINKDNYNVSISSGEVKVVYNEKYSSFEDYLLNSKVYGQMFNRINYNRTNKYIDLYVNEPIKSSNNLTQKSGTNLIDFDIIQVNIINPFKVNYTNAELVNDNTYTWTIKNDDLTKNIQIQFKPTFNKIPYKALIVGLLMLAIIIGFSTRFYKRYKNKQSV